MKLRLQSPGTGLSFLLAALLLSLAIPRTAVAGVGRVQAHRKIAWAMEGQFSVLEHSLNFGSGLANLGDLDGDGITEIAVGANHDDPITGEHGVVLGGRGAVWVLSLDSEGTVRKMQKIGMGEGNFTGTLEDDASFGSSIAALGDLDDDGVQDIAVSSPFVGSDRFSPDGAVWILFLRPDGMVKSHHQILPAEGPFADVLPCHSLFGEVMTGLGDLDKDGVEDLAVGVSSDDNGRGSVRVLFLNADGSIKGHQKIGSGEGGLTGSLPEGEVFGGSLTCLGDLDGDGVQDLAVGAASDNDGGPSRGSVWVLFLRADGTVKSHQKISDTSGGFRGGLENFDAFGFAVASLGDLDSDGVRDLAVGSSHDVGRVEDVGAAWLLCINRDGTVKSHNKISQGIGGFKGKLQSLGGFATALASLGDLDGNGFDDLAVGEQQEYNPELDQHAGAVWILLLDVPSGGQIPSDCNQDGFLDVSDGVCLLGNLFLGVPGGASLRGQRAPRRDDPTARL